MSLNLRQATDTPLVRDWRGVPIEIGSRIVYPTRHGSSMDIKEAEVLEIHPCDDDSNPRYLADCARRRANENPNNLKLEELAQRAENFCFYLKVRFIRNHDGWLTNQQCKTVTLHVVDRVTVVD
jgi:hypothetical protein